MRCLRTPIIPLCTVLLLGFAPLTTAETLVIITQRTNPLSQLSFKTLKRVYLRKSLLDHNDKRWVPVNLPASHVLRQAFSLALFKKLPEDQESYWNEQYFQGISPPEVLASEESVVRFIAITPGAIGYVRKRAVDARVKILLTIPVPDPD